MVPAPGRASVPYPCVCALFTYLSMHFGVLGQLGGSRCDYVCHKSRLKPLETAKIVFASGGSLWQRLRRAQP